MADISTTLDNIKAHWKLEEASGTRVDEMGSFNLTDNNTTGQGAGKQGDAANFTPNDNLSRASEAQWGYKHDGGSANTQLSISFWFKADSVTGVQGLVGYYESSQQGHEWLIYLNGTSLILLVRNAGTAITHGSAISTATWYHVVVTMDNTNAYKMYVNGGAATTGSGAVGAGTSNNTFRIGASSNTATNFFDGIIDEVTITTDVITSGEVATIYNSGNGIPWLSANTIVPSMASLGVGA